MDFNYLEGPLKNYLENVSAKLPCPGGGSVVALVGCLSSALVSMVANFTIGKKAYLKNEMEIKQVLEENEILKNNLATFIEKDSEIYEKIQSLSKENPLLVQKYLKESANLHLNIAENTKKILYYTGILLEKGNKNLISDVGISAVLSVSTFYGAKINAEINLKYIKDEKFINEVRNFFDLLEKEIKSIGEKIYNEVIKIIKS